VTPLGKVWGYLEQPQTSHSQTAQVQDSPSQPLHSQTSLNEAADASGIFAAQQVLRATAGAAAARTHPQLPHSHSSHEQKSPLQFGH